MTENKRFSHKKWYDDRQLFDGDEPFAIVDVYIQADTICNKLNELNDEVERLKQYVKYSEIKTTLINGWLHDEGYLTLKKYEEILDYCYQQYKKGVLND